ncbi:MAG: sorbosone dehydrogenase family protein [Deltaproteobacteria bacterium]|nr:MAG: sorbosone dehydrogenase family protein [Deltaproteobacteria bacterium]
MRTPLLLAPAITGAVLLSCSPSPDPAPSRPPAAARAAPEPPARGRASASNVTLTGQAARGDWTTDAPGARRKLTPADLPAPYATPSADNGPTIVRRPAGALPRVPDGFVVDVLTGDVRMPRMIRTAPNGDIFVVESAAGRVKVVRGADRDAGPERVSVFATGLRQPFGIAFYPPDAPKWVYVANTDSVVRFPYAEGDLTARGAAERIIDSISGGGRLRGGGHWTRDVVFSADGSKMYVSVGSRSNVSDDEAEARRARIFEYTPDGKNERVFATGIRNPVGLAVHPVTHDLWTSVNERDELGDHLVPDYITRVRDGGFYGWPWFYIGPNQDPRHKGKHPELRDKVIVPDVLLQSHSASLGMMFYTATQFPEAYRGQAFAAEHGSWNRARRTGYKVIWVPLKDGVPTGEYVDFMTGMVTADGNVWGRPVAVTQTQQGALVVSDDAGNCLWRIRYRGVKAR